MWKSPSWLLPRVHLMVCFFWSLEFPLTSAATNAWNKANTPQVNKVLSFLLLCQILCLIWKHLGYETWGIFPITYKISRLWYFIMILGKTALGMTGITTTLCNELSVLLPFKWLLWRWGPSFANLKVTLVRGDGHRMSMRQLACYLSAISLKLKGLKLVCDNIVINCEKFQPPKITNLLRFPEHLLPSTYTEIHINSLHSESSQKLH